MYYLCIAPERTCGKCEAAPEFFRTLWSSKRPRGASRRRHLVKTTKHLVKITKHLAKNTKHLVKNTKEAVLREREFRGRKSTAKMLPKVINVNATMHFGPSKGLLQASRGPAASTRSPAPSPPPPARKLHAAASLHTDLPCTDKRELLPLQKPFSYATKQSTIEI